MRQVGKNRLAAKRTRVAGYIRFDIVNDYNVLRLVAADKAGVCPIEFIVIITAGWVGDLSRAGLTADDKVRWEIKIAKAARV